MKKYQEEGNYNARIGIDYNKDKPKVSFSYPDKKTQVKGSMGMVVFNYYCYLLCIIFIILYFFTNSISLLHIQYANNDLQDFTSCAVKYPNETLTNFYLVRNDLCKEQIIEIKPTTTFYLITILFLSVLFIPMLIYLPFKKKWDKLFPKYMAWRSKRKVRIFKKEDVREPREKGFKYKYYVELPVFSNIILDFKATKDFSKYMKYFEIREYKFNYLKKEKIRIGKKKGFGKGKYRKYKKVNEWIWYARWYFNEKPLKGELEVLYN